MPTQAEVAEHLGLDGASATKRVRELRDQGKIPDPRKASIDKIRIAYIRHLRAVAAGRDQKEGGAINLVAEKARLASEQADQVSLKNAESRGELVRADAMVEQFARMILAARERIRGVASLAARTLGLTKKQTVGLQKLIDQALREVSEDDPDGDSRGRRRGRRKKSPRSSSGSVGAAA